MRKQSLLLSMTLRILYPTDDNMTIVLQLSTVVTAIYSADISDVTESVRGRVGQCLF